MNVLKLILFNYLLILAFNSIKGINYPITPTVTEPKVSALNETMTSNTEQKSKTEESKIQTVEVRVIVTLGNGSTITGEIQIPNNISFSHTKNGFFFNKTILAEEIKSITILEFAQHRIGATENNTVQYEFQPSKISILLHNSKEYQINYLFKFLLQFKIKTDDGYTQLFSFFSDSFNQYTGWKEVQSKDSLYHVSIPHRNSIKKILFFSEHSSILK